MNKTELPKDDRPLPDRLEIIAMRMERAREDGSRWIGAKHVAAVREAAELLRGLK